MSRVYRRAKRKKNNNLKTKKEYFSNNISIDEFSKKMIQDLSSLKSIITLLKEMQLASKEVEALEYEAFNLLINRIEFEKGNNKVEVGVIGSFSSGKSTFINSLFGKPVCPMSVKPTTSSITKFYYGYQEKITINDEEITQAKYQNLSQHLDNDTKNTKTNYIEYAYPFESFNSIVLYDTPGFNNNLNENDTKVTMKTLNSVDVIFFVVDISKGTIDKSSIERLEELKDKRMYCILNKSDLKSADAIAKIKKEIESKRLFLEIIEYSALKVLKASEVDHFTENMKRIENELIAREIEFTHSITGSVKKTKGRLKTNVEYELKVDNKVFKVDSFHVKAKAQRARVEKMLNTLAKSKKDTLKQKVKTEEHRYYQKSSQLFKEILSCLASNNSSYNQFEQFNQDISKFKSEVYEFERSHIDNFYKEWNYNFIRSCRVMDVDDERKPYWSTPYSEIVLNKEKFKQTIKSMEFIKFMDELLTQWNNYFYSQHNFILQFFDFKEKIASEALTRYSNYFDVKGNILNKNEDIYFKDKNEAREYLETFSTFEAKSTISILHSFMEKNKKNIEQKKMELHTESEVEKTKKKELKEELNKFLEEKKAYVTSI